MKKDLLGLFHRGIWLIPTSLLWLLVSCGGPKENLLELYIGTYTAESSQGIYRLLFDSAKGTFTTPELVGEIDNPSYIAFDPSVTMLYAVSEGENDESSALNAFAVAPEDGSLSLISRHPTHGAAPCYVKVTGEYVFTANYLGGSITLFPIAEDGSTGEAIHVERFVEEGDVAHLHGVFEGGDGRLLATDLGLDKMYEFVPVKMDEGEVDLQLFSTTSFAEGFGPRHLARSKEHIYVLGELSGEVAVMERKDDEWRCIQTIPSDSVGGGGCADIHLSPDERFLYASNRLKEDGISTFSVGEDGTLTKIDYTHTGVHPRNFTLTPDGRWLLCANRDSDNIQIFERDIQTGLLTNTGREVKLSMPVCLVWRM